MPKTALIIVSDGTEQAEAVIPADVLRRAGVDVTIASLQDRKTVICTQKVSINADALLSDVADRTFDVVVLPGGQPGSDNLASDSRVGEILRRQESSGGVIAAICAGPLAIKSHGIAKGATLTSYPLVRDQLKAAGYQYSEESVAVCKNIITSRGPGTAFKFALKIAEHLVGAETARSVCNELLIE